MAKKKRPIVKQEKTQDPREERIIYQILADLVIVCLALIAARLISVRYGYVDQMVNVYNGMRFGIAAGIVVAVIGVVLVAALRKRSRAAYAIGGAMIPVGILVALSALLFRIYVLDAVHGVYFIWIAAAVLYALYLLYQREFLLISILTTIAGFSFVFLSRRIDAGFSGSVLALYVIVIVLALLLAAITMLAGKNGGRLKLGGKEILIYSGRSQIPLYLASALWILCLILILPLGGAFAYYCLFAAIAYEFIMAVYYTIKLSA